MQAHFCSPVDVNHQNGDTEAGRWSIYLKGDLLFGQFASDAVGDLHEVGAGQRPVQSLGRHLALLGVVMVDAEGGGVQLRVHKCERWGQLVIDVVVEAAAHCPAQVAVVKP